MLTNTFTVYVRKIVFINSYIGIYNKNENICSFEMVSKNLLNFLMNSNLQHR